MLSARTVILGLVAVVLGVVVGHLLLRRPASAPPPDPSTTSPTPGLTGPLPFAPEGPVPCRLLPKGQLLLLYPAASASASPLSPAPSEIETNAIKVVPPEGAGTEKAWVYIVISEAEPEVTVSVPETPGPGQPAASEDTEPNESG